MILKACSRSKQKMVDDSRFSCTPPSHSNCALVNAQSISVYLSQVSKKSLHIYLNRSAWFIVVYLSLQGKQTVATNCDLKEREGRGWAYFGHQAWSMSILWMHLLWSTAKRNHREVKYLTAPSETWSVVILGLSCILWFIVCHRPDL
jgi:hypothetical protein